MSTNNIPEHELTAAEMRQMISDNKAMIAELRANPVEYGDYRYVMHHGGIEAMEGLIAIQEKLLELQEAQENEPARQTDQATQAES